MLFEIRKFLVVRSLAFSLPKAILFFVPAGRGVSLKLFSDFGGGHKQVIQIELKKEKVDKKKERTKKEFKD